MHRAKLLMSDQAENLRRLVSHRVPTRGAGGAQLVVLSGAKGGVGVTTLALNLAVALKQNHGETLLIDTSPARGDLALTYRLDSQRTLDDVLQLRCSIRQAITPGPGGIHVLPRTGVLQPLSGPMYWQFLRQLDEVVQEYQFVVVDSGTCTAAIESIWTAAQRVIVVANPQQMELMDAYALIKHARNRNVPIPSIGLAINRYQQESLALDVQRRIVRSCEQFLQWSVEPIGCVPEDMQWQAAAREARALACANSSAPAAMAIQALAANILTNRNACPAPVSAEAS